MRGSRARVALSVLALLAGGCDRGTAHFTTVVGDTTGGTSGSTTGSTPTPDAGPCDAGLLDCVDVCVDPLTDATNCGGCGIMCGQGQRCAPQGSAVSPKGACVCDTTVLNGADLILCDGGCVHSFSDSMNCGACGALCLGPCTRYTCYPCDVDGGLVACPPPICVAVETDVYNCGSCGNDCTQGGTAPFSGIECFHSRCVCDDGGGDICPSPDPTLPFPTMECIDPNLDPDNCGGCGLLADGGGPFPDGGLPSSPYVCAEALRETIDCNKGSCVTIFGSGRLACESAMCLCPSESLYCPPGSWKDDSGIPNDAGACLDDSLDSFNCGGCGNDCGELYEAGAICVFATCSCWDGGLCVNADNEPLSPSCACDCLPPGVDAGPMSHYAQNLTFQTDVFPLLSSTTVTDEPTWPSGGVLIGCAVSGCHDSTAAAGLDFTDPDASYQALAGGKSSVEMCPFTPVSIINPSQVCFCQSLVIPFDSADSLLYELLVNSSANGLLPLSSVCAEPDGGVLNPMPTDDGGTFHPLSPCLVAVVQQWIDQGAAY
jgi:hypothetical protein